MTTTSNIHVGLAAWSNHTFTLGERCSNAGNAYQCITAGTSTSAPTGTSSDVDNGGAAHFKWLSAINYTTLQAWSDAILATLTQPVIGLVWNDGAITTTSGVPVLDISGHVTTSTNTITLTTATGESLRDHAGTAWAVNTTLGVTIDLPATGVGGVNYININNPNVVINGIQFRDSNSGSGSTILNTTAVDNVKLTGCILDGYAQTLGATMLSLFGTTFLATNCLFIDRQPPTAIDPLVYGDTGATGKFVGCTFISTTANTDGPAIRWVNTTTNSCLVKDCVLMGWSTATVGESAGPIALDHCVLSGTIDTSFSTDAGNNLVSKTAANQFVSTTTDFRIKTGADAIGAGAVDTTDIPTADDFFRVARGASWDSGGAEFAASFVNGSATINGGATLVVTPIRVVWASDTISASVFFGGGVRPWTVDFSADFGPITASGGVNVTLLPGDARATLTCSALIIPTATVRAAIGATLAGSAVLVSGATHTPAGAATLSGAGQAIANSSHTPTANATVPAVNTVAVQANVLRAGLSGIAGSSSVTANPAHNPTAASVVGTSGLITSDPSHAPSGSAIILGNSSVAPIATTQNVGLATLAATGEVTANSTHTPVGVATLSGTGSTVVDLKHTSTGAASLAVAGTLSADAFVEAFGIYASSSITALGSVASIATAVERIAATLSGSAILVGTATASQQATIEVDGTATVIANTLAGFVNAVVPGSATLAVGTKVFAAGASALSGSAVLSTVTRQSSVGRITINSSGSVTADSGNTYPAGSTVSGAGSVVASAGHATTANFVVAGAGLVTADSVVYFSASSVVSGAGFALGGASHTVTASSTLTGSGPIVAGSYHTSLSGSLIQGGSSVTGSADATSATTIVFNGSGSVIADTRHTSNGSASIVSSGLVLIDPSHTPLVEGLSLSGGSLVNAIPTAMLQGSAVLLGEMSFSNSGDRLPTAVTSEIDATGNIDVDAVILDTQTTCRISGVGQVISGGIPSQFAEVVIGGATAVSVQAQFTFHRRGSVVSIGDYPIPWIADPSRRC